MKSVTMVPNYFNLVRNNNNDVGARLLEYTLSTPYDLRTLSLVTSAGIEFDEPDVSSKMLTIQQYAF